MKTAATKAAVIPFRTRDRLADEEELPVGMPAPSVSAVAPSPLASAVDLTGKPKIWFAIGPGRSGKTMLLRWAAEMCINLNPAVG